MKRLTATTLILTAILAVAPLRSRAGDREWANAGKVMAGILGYQLITNMYDGPSRTRYEQPVRHVREVRCEPVRRGPPHREPVVVTHYGTVDYITPRRTTVAYSSWQPTVVVDDSRTDAAEERARLAEERARLAEQRAQLAEQQADLAAARAVDNRPADVVVTNRAVRRDNGLVLQINGEQRLWQPAEKGAIAYLQVWSEVEQTWVNMKEYPSFY